MTKYLKRYGTKTLLDTVQASTTGQPWVGSETMTNTVRYEPKGIVETVDSGEIAPGTPEIGDGEKEMQ